ncbi:preprotein translocase subunit YajC [Homoserinibacter sp. GY 40078]|uniref:preprotein translocase subunit YajC n=1 Tax=Homoserinibacter sp. GY 40078 TaxID=2603275 RepID=UPI0011CA5092|nr:preprotein translocase subunit YajC [Homoserinibacter sp. GY 40078]TXK17523.1 preprotein translocase subunit YajC [Homoserinibacter sp. GY 40078]
MPDITLILLAGLLVVMIFFTWRSSRKRRADAEEMQTKLVPGAEVMTQHGIYGTLISLDEEKNEAILETTPGTLLRLHRQTIARVVDPIEAEPADEADDDAAELDSDIAPEFGERVEKPSASEKKSSDPSETE